MLVKDVSISKLRDCPDTLETVIAWIDKEWGEFSGRSLSETREKFEQELGSDELPVSIIAIENGVPVGVATLRESDSVDWDSGKQPWICNVYVSETSRGRGVAGNLCRELEILAAGYGFRESYLATALASETLYHQLGYVEYKAVENKGHIFHLLRRRIAHSTARGCRN